MAQARRTKSAKSRAKISRREKTRIVVVEARFYDYISDALLKGATRVLNEAGVSFDRLTVPGSLEIPAARSEERRVGKECRL